MVAASVEFECGRLDVAEPFAAASVRRWDGGSRPPTRSDGPPGRYHSGLTQPRAEMAGEADVGGSRLRTLVGVVGIENF